MKNKDMKNKDFEIVDGVLKKYHGSDECVGVPYGVRKIGDEAFKGAASLKKLIMPETVEGIGDLAFEGCMHLESAVIVEYKKSFFERLSGKFKKKEEYNHLPYSARTVGVRAFADCVSLLNVDLPVGVNRLCKEAFCGCMNLPMIVLPSSVEEIEEKAFFTCKSLKNVKLSSDIARIGGSAFADTSLQEIDIPDSIKYVVQGAFPENIRFTGVSYEDILARNALVDEEIKRKENKKAEEEKRRKEHERKTVERRGLWSPSYMDDQEKKKWSEIDSIKVKDEFVIKDNVLKKYTGNGNDVKIPDSVYEIGESAFCQCATLERVVFSDNLKSIGSKAFYNCVNLSEIVLPHSVESIDKFAFSSCHSIEKLEIKADKIKIEARAFANCLMLKEISISANFADIGELAFFMCNNLKSVNITCSYNMNIGYGAFSECEKLKDVYLSGWLTDIDDLLFSKCKSLTNVKIPYSVCNIGVRAFEECVSLENIKLPEGVHNIGNMAFNGCELLSKIDMPAKIRNMGYDAFKGCVRLKNLTVNGKPVDTGREIVTPITKKKTETVTKVKSNTVSKTQNKTQTPTEVRYHRYTPENKESAHKDVDKAVNAYSNKSNNANDLGEDEESMIQTVVNHIDMWFQYENKVCEKFAEQVNNVLYKQRSLSCRREVMAKLCEHAEEFIDTPARQSLNINGGEYIVSVKSDKYGAIKKSADSIISKYNINTISDKKETANKERTQDKSKEKNGEKDIIEKHYELYEKASQFVPEGRDNAKTGTDILLEHRKELNELGILTVQKLNTAVLRPGVEGGEIIREKEGKITTYYKVHLANSKTVIKEQMQRMYEEASVNKAKEKENEKALYEKALYEKAVKFLTSAGNTLTEILMVNKDEFDKMGIFTTMQLKKVLKRGVERGEIMEEKEGKVTTYRLV